MTTEPDAPFEHWCEACGRTVLRPSEEVCRTGWDFPPRMVGRHLPSPMHDVLDARHGLAGRGHG